MAVKTLTTRRKLLAGIPAATIAVITAQPALAEMSRMPKPGLSKASPELRALIGTHRTAYAALVETIRAANAGKGERAKADRVEEKALLAVCAFPARSDGDRRAKARYLLAIEARGELDLPQHMRAVLRASMA